MLKERARIIAGSLLASDLVMVAFAFLVAYRLRDRTLPALGLFEGRGIHDLGDYLPLLPLALACWAVLLVASGRYRSARTATLAREAWEVVRASALAFGALVLLIYAFRLEPQLLDDDRLSRSWIFLFAALATLFLLVERLLVRLGARWVRARGFNYRTVLIVGANDRGASIARSLSTHPYWGLEVLGFVRSGEGVAPRDADRAAGEWPVLGDLDDLPHLVEENVVDEVVFAVQRRDLVRLEDLFLHLEDLGIRTRIALDLLPHVQAHVGIEELDGQPYLTFSTAPSSPVLLAFKRVGDLLISAAVLVLTLPLIALIALAIRLTSDGAVLFRQTRCGLNGRRFTLYKFRTMVEGAEERREELEALNEMRGPVFKVRDDPRVTRVGRLLRRFSLDELPQLWNVLRGDMSLVGPRPPIPAEVAQYERWQRRRLSMKPGLTCLWQVSGRNQIDFERWMEMDLQYIDSWSPVLDIKILLKTIPAVLSGRGAS